MINIKIKLPENVKVIIEKLNNFGFEAYVVGGCVRDSLIGLIPHDWDICTNAKPQKIIECFKNYNYFDAGLKHGTVSVVIAKEVFEITTYRIDGQYSDNRHPKSVTFTDDIVQDLARRDFTVNAMAYNEKTGIVDPFGGQNDITSKTIRCVGNPTVRFNEDALRIMRAVRFASVYDYSIEELTSLAIKENVNLLKNIASERINTELTKLLCGVNAENILNSYRDVIAVFIPEIKPLFDFEQKTPHHNRDIWRHTTCAVNSIEPTPLLRVTMLLHDIGKPDKCKIDENGRHHFKGHPHISAHKANVILRRLKYPSLFIDDCLMLIKYHDVRFTGSKRQLRHVMSAIGDVNVGLLLKVQRADIMAQSMYKQNEKLDTLELACNAYNEIIAENECFTLKQLAVNGNDLMAIGITKGIEIGQILKRLLSLVIDEKIQNSKSALINKAIEIHEVNIKNDELNSK